MLTVHQPRIFSRNLVLYDGSSVAGEIRLSAWTGSATIHVGDTSYSAIRSGWFRNDYSLEKDGVEIMTAKQIGFWSPEYQIETGSGSFTMRRKQGWFETGFELLDGNSPVGSVTRTGVLRTTTTAEFHPQIDRVLQAFVVWIANVRWQQDQSAAAAAG